MKRIILCLSFFAFFGSQAQQINPVPDYVFSNKMSVGRNAVTDTAAYFSIGPRYGAVRGFMPPMVTDTATITTGKRNGLTIFSIQKNKYMYWDSVRVRWSDFAGSSGAYIFASDTSSMLSPYIRAAGSGLTKSGQSLLVDTLTISTRAWRQKGDDSLGALIGARIGGSGTTHTIPKFTASTSIGNSNVTDDGTTITLGQGTRINGPNAARTFLQLRNNGTPIAVFGSDSAIFDGAAADVGLFVYGANNFDISSNSTRRMRINTGGEVLINTLTDAGAYALQVAGSIYNTTGAVLAASSGELIVGSTSSASRKLYVTSNSDVARFEQTASDKNMVIELLHTNPNASGTIREESINFLSPNTSTRGRITFYPSDTFNVRNYLAFFTPSGSGTNAERMRIANDGNVGIGTTSPSSLLEVNATSPRIRVVGTTGGAVNQYVTDGGQMFVGIDNSSASLFGNGAYSRVIYGGNAYPLDFYTNDLIRARITSAGELLINTTSDAGAYALQVAGSIYNTTGAVFAVSSGNVGIGNANPGRTLVVDGKAAGGVVQITNNTAGNTAGNGLEIVSSGLDAFISVKNNGYLGFATNNTERIRIESGGSVGIGTAAPSGSALLDVSSTTKGFLPPRMTSAERDAISGPAAGLVIYNTTTSKLQVYTTAWTDLH